MTSSVGRPMIEWEDGWRMIREEGIGKLKMILDGFDVKFQADEYMFLYTQVYNMCTQKPPHEHSENLYNHFREEVLEEYVSNTVLTSIENKKQQAGPEGALSELTKRWANHNLMVKWSSRFFAYLERYYIARRSLLPLREVGLVSFREIVYLATKDETRDTVVAMVDRERKGEHTNRSLLREVKDLFVGMGSDKSGEEALGIYQTDLEESLLEDAAAFYGRQATTWLQEYSCPEYMKKVEHCLNLEKDRVQNYLHNSTEPKLLENVRQELLAAHVDQLLEKEHTGLRVMLREDMVDDLSLMYRLFSKVNNGLEPVSRIFKEHVTSEGSELVKQSEDASAGGGDGGKTSGTKEHAFVRKVMELHDKYMTHVSTCFQNHTLFHKALKEAFEVFFNKKIAGCESSELLAAFANYTLQKSGEDDDTVEGILEKIVQLLAYVADKDMFGEFCRKMLGRRLLFDRSANGDHERSFLAKLKQNYGGQFTSKMEGMLNDLALSKEQQLNFDEYLNNNPQANPGTSLAVTVLTTGIWPSYKPSELNFPVEMVKCIESFKEFYKTNTKSRKLTLIPSLGSCTVSGKFAKKTMELVVSTYQAAALMLFNNSDRLSYSEIKTQLNLSDDDVFRVLHSLSCAKYKLLKKVPNTKSINQNDQFEFNSEFTDRMRRIKIPLPPSDEKKKIIEDVKQDRRYAVDACVVRIMKTRKVIGYQQLNLECIEQLSRMFKPDVKLIKMRIEDLITREFLERDPENPNVFKYIA